MDTIRLPPDFKDFLKLLHEHDVRYLLIGGYAVSYHGYPRTTADIDIWIDRTVPNARKVLKAVNAFGLVHPELTEQVFLKPDSIFRMGHPPIRIEILSGISGVSFKDCHPDGIEDQIDGVSCRIIDLDNLKKNKKNAARHKDLNDLSNLL